jgi:ssDNA-binding Zn-finger/Zn-ribbon topoisomerase 1
MTMKTKSFTYILPLMAHFIDLRKRNLVNTFIGCSDYPELDNHIFLLYKFHGTKEYILYEEELENNTLFEKKFDPDKEHVMFAFKVPEDYQDVYNQFKAGKYSELPEDYKIQIFKYHNILSADHKVAKVLFKHPDLREELEERIGVEIPENMEVSSIPDMNLEIY